MTFVPPYTSKVWYEPLKAKQLPIASGNLSIRFCFLLSFKAEFQAELNFETEFQTISSMAKVHIYRLQLKGTHVTTCQDNSDNNEQMFREKWEVRVNHKYFFNILSHKGTFY